VIELPRLDGLMQAGGLLSDAANRKEAVESPSFVPNSSNFVPKGLSHSGNRKASSARPSVFTSAASLTCKAQQLANSAATLQIFLKYVRSMDRPRQRYPIFIG
jgi:hypothetical protein